MSEIVYVSKSNLSHALNHLDTSKEKSEIVRQFEDYLTNFQLENIYKVNGLKAHFDIHGEVKLRKLAKDDFTLINPDKHSRFHLKQDCTALNSNYYNGYIPKEFQNPIDAPQYRAWSREVIKKIEKDGTIPEETYRLLHQNRWGFAYKGKLESGINRGSKELNSFTKRELIAEAFKIRIRIDQQIVEELEQRDYSTLLYLPKYSKVKKQETEEEKFKKLVQTNGDDYPRVLSWLKNYRESYQYPLANIFRDLFLMMNFPDCSLEIDLARALGFLPCKNCAGKA